MQSIEEVEMTLKSPFSLERKRILVVGASGGIGQAAAEICAEQGAEVILADLTERQGARQAPALSTADYYRVDIADRSAVDRMAANIGAVWAVIDAAGISPLDDWMDPEWDRQFDRVIDVNLRGPLNLARAFMPGMIAAKGGRIVLTGSVSGRMGGIKCGPHYAGAKGGLHALTRWLAQKGVSHDVLVNAVAPGSIDTPMAAAMKIDPLLYPQGRAGRPREMGATLAFLCSPGAGFISGTVIDVNGGTYFG